MRLYFTFFAIFLFNGIIAQRSDLTGILKDVSGEPLIFALIINKTTNLNYETDIDGRYCIPCKVGDVLSISYVGYDSKEIIVTEEMIQSKMLNKKATIKYASVSPIKSDDFSKLLNKAKEQDSNTVADSSNIVHTLNDMKPMLNYHYQMDDFKDTGKAIQIVAKNRVFYYGTKIQHTTGTSFIQDKNLPSLQTTFGPGLYIDGQLELATSQFSWGKPLAKEMANPAVFKSNFFHDTRLAFAINDHSYCDKNVLDVVLVNTENRDIFNVNKNYYRSLRVQSTPLKNKFFGLSYEYKTALNKDNNSFGYYANAIKNVLLAKPSSQFNQNEKDNASFPFSMNEKNELSSSSHILTSSYKKYNGRQTVTNITSAEYGLGNYRFFIPAKQSFLLQSSSLELRNRLDYEKELDGYNYNNYLMLRSDIDFNLSHFNTTNNGIHAMGSNQLFIARNYIGVKGKRQHFDVAFGNNFTFSNWQKPTFLLPSLGVIFKNDHNQKFGASAVFNRNVSDFNLRDVQASFTTVNFSSYQQGIENTFTPFYTKEGIKNEIENTVSLKSVWKVNQKLLVNFSYNYLDKRNAIYPVWNKDKFLLENTADFESHAFKLLLSAQKWNGNNSISYGAKLELIKYFGHVNKVTLQDGVVFLYGFQNASKVWLKNKPLGTIYGYDYKRNKDGILLIDEAGFPIKNNERSIIGNTTPDLVLSLIPHLQVKNFLFEAIVNVQIGGQVWDGTSLSLDYHGASTSSAAKRKIIDYIYPGFTSDNQQNSKVVNLDNLENSYLNRWMRHGEDGVSIDGIRNASHFVIKMLKCTYRPSVRYNEPLAISLFVENLLTIASYQGFTNTPLLDINSSNGINYFNRPIQTSIGISITLKI